MSNIVQTLQTTKSSPKFSVDLILQEGQYLADILTEDVIRQWKRGHKVLITANTGAGKTYFVMHTLYKMLKAPLPSGKTTPRSMLFLTNRVTLREQLINLYGNEVDDVVTFMNYQSLINYIKFQKEKIHDRFDLIVADECHWFFTDSTFANGTDIPLKYLITECDKSSIVFLSATSRILEEYFEQNYKDKLNFKYRIMNPYVFSEYYYWSDQEVIKKLLLELPKDEKAIFFCKSIKTALLLHNSFPDNSSLICSPRNKKYGELCDVDTLESLQKSEKFEKQILFTTSIIENGINICDPALKHIIVDLYDFDSIIQCLGRRRVKPGETPPFIYVRQVRQSTVSTVVNNTNTRLKPLEYFRSHNNDQFCKVYGDKNLHGLLYTENLEKDENICKYTINSAKGFKYLYDLKLANEMNAADTKMGHLKLFCQYIRIEFERFKDLSNYFTAITLEDKLNFYLNRPLFAEEKTQFVELLKKEVLKPLQGGYKVDTVNTYFDNIGLPYQITTKHQTNRKKEHYGKNGWILQVVKNKPRRMA